MGQESEPLTFDELTSIYRVECRSTGLSDVRKDMYKAVAELSESIYKEYEHQLSVDPGSLVCEGINERRKRIESLSQKIVEMRMEKVTKLAMRVAMGDGIDTEFFTPEEKDYYNVILDSSKKHRSLISRSRPKTKDTVLKVESEAVVHAEVPKKEKSKPEVQKTPEAEEVQNLADIPVEPERGEEFLEDECELWDEPDVKCEDTPFEIVEKEEEIPIILDDDDEGDVIIRILEDLQEFSGRDVDYRLKKEDVVKMPAILANALISRELAVKIDTTL
jgi:hypothetical protein